MNPQEIPPLPPILLPDQSQERKHWVRAIDFMIGEHPFWDDWKRGKDISLALLPRLVAASIFGCLLIGLPLFIIFLPLEIVLSGDEVARLERLFSHEYGIAYLLVCTAVLAPKLLSRVFDEAMLIELWPSSPQSMPQARLLAVEAIKKGIWALESKDYKSAMQFFRKAAVQGYALAEYNIGLMYHHGYGVPQDYDQAMQWYRNVVYRGLSDGIHNAAINIGLMYENGEGVTQDYAEAMKWFRMAAEQGSALGQNKMGYLYYNGRGVSQDYTKALKWFRMAADQEFVPGDYRDNPGFFHDIPHAQYIVGTLYANGLGVSQDYEQARQWYRKAADKSEYDEAQLSIGVLYENGWGVPQDNSQARYWYGLATAQGNEDARRALSGLPPN